MSVAGEHRFRIKLTSELKNKTSEFEENSTSIIPATVFANIISSTNEILQATWDYAWWYPSDERFKPLRELDAGGIIDRRNTELVIVNIKTGSIETFLDWSIAFYGASVVFQQVPPNIIANALWDLTKYSFGAIKNMISGSKEKNENDPLKNNILPYAESLVRHAYHEAENHASFYSDFYYKDSEHEFSFKVDKQAQSKILAENELDIDQASRLIGIVVGFDLSENIIGIRFELFPEQTFWCDIGGMDFDEIMRLVKRHPKEPPKRVGFDVELVWRKGAFKRLPPDSIRIIQIIPESDFKKHNFASIKELHRPPVYKIDDNLSVEEVKLLNWLFWMDKAWEMPTYSGIVGYLSKTSKIFDNKLNRAEIEILIKSFVQRGILLRARNYKKQDPHHQTLRLNRNHPAVLRYANEKD